MSTLEKYLGRLKALKTQLAVESLRDAGNITEGNYGYILGIQNGLERALKLLDEVLKEEAGKE